MATLLQGFVLLISGISIVFAFLMLLVWVMNQMALVIPKINHILPDEEPKKSKAATAKGGTQNHNRMVAIAIAAARARSM